MKTLITNTSAIAIAALVMGAGMVSAQATNATGQTQTTPADQAANGTAPAILLPTAGGDNDDGNNGGNNAGGRHNDHDDNDRGNDHDNNGGGDHDGGDHDGGDHDGGNDD